MQLDAAGRGSTAVASGDAAAAAAFRAV
jgi:hypothetical protein